MARIDPLSALGAERVAVGLIVIAGDGLFAGNARFDVGIGGVLGSAELKFFGWGKIIRGGVGHV